MFLCPLSSNKLRSAFVRGVNIWYSPENGGRFITLAAFRKILGEDIATELWVRSGVRGVVTSWKKCPSCSHHLKIVDAPKWAGAYEVDLCRNCRLVWLDQEDFPQVPTPDDMISPHGDATLVASVTNDMARIAVDQDRRDNPGLRGEGPSSMWKTVPGYIGFPVEMEDHRKNGLGWVTWLFAGIMLLLHSLTNENAEVIEAWSFLPADPSSQFGLTTLSWGFLHADWFHLLTNLYFFGVFADDVEIYYGKKKFLILVSGCLIFSSLATLVVYHNPEIPHVGISGVICALMINYGLIYRKSRIAFFLPYMHSLGSGQFTRVFGWVRISALWVIVGFFAKDLLFYTVYESSNLANVSHSGHIYGTIFGFVFWFANGSPNWYYDSVPKAESSVKERLLMLGDK